MRSASHIYWLLWFAVGFGIPEAYGVFSKDFDTLSATWTWLRDMLPAWAAITASGMLSAALVWLATIHWIWQIWNRPGFDAVEKLVVLVGFVSGVAGAVAVRRRRVDSPIDEEAGD